MTRTVDLFVYLLDDRLYALPLPRVLRVVRAVELTPLPDAPEKIAGAINVEGTVLPVFDMRRLCGLAARELRLSDQIILAEAHDRMVGLLVDGVRDIYAVPTETITEPDSVSPGLKLIQGVAGFDDDVLLVSNLDAFLSREEGAQLDSALSK